MKNSLSEIQQLELEALKEIKLIAEKNDIKFFLRGGSVMGAVKYGGFIPWDDDMDIAVPRGQFEKLMELLKNDWSDKFWLANYRNGDEIHAYFPRVLVKESFRKQKNLPTNNHLGFSIIDVLPLDGVPGTFLERKFYKYHVMILRGMGAVFTRDVKDTIVIHSKKKQFAIDLLGKLGVKHLYTQDKIYDKIDVVYRKNKLQGAKWVGTITGSLFDKEIFPADYFGEGVSLNFEDTEFLVPAKYDEYLKQLYGNNYAFEEPDHKKSHIEVK
ncbi:LicD family protein [Weissella paramesenteroides]|uniref:LicD family protein n=1 Tax=Weissella paramesenteroides TaxID=1249 RepID=UPI003F745D30